jgi:hypothetical protein
MGFYIICLRPDSKRNIFAHNIFVKKNQNIVNMKFVKINLSKIPDFTLSKNICKHEICQRKVRRVKGALQDLSSTSSIGNKMRRRVHSW